MHSIQTELALFEPLGSEELVNIEGGTDGRSFWGDAVYLVAATARCIYEFTKTAVEYQHSLPANLKK